jgi:hypothetical protein
MLDYGAVDGAAEVCMLVRDDASLVTDSVVYILSGSSSNLMEIKYENTHLESSFSQELIARPEWDLDDCAKLGHLPRSIILNIGNTLQKRELSGPQETAKGY